MRYLIRLIRVALCCTLVADPTTASGFSPQPQAAGSLIKIPARYGRITDSFGGSAFGVRGSGFASKKDYSSNTNPETRIPKPVVVLIQDLHGNLGVQRNIAEIIKYLARGNRQRATGNRTSHSAVARCLMPVASFLPVFLEGAWGPFDVSPFRNIEDPWVKRQILDRLLTDFKLTGAEVAASQTVQPLHLWGIEDKDLYLENLKAFYQASLHSPVPHPKNKAWTSFYGLAQKRNIPLTLKTLEHMDLLRKTASPPSLVVLVAGGYHTLGITQLLKANQVPYVVVTPVVSSLGYEHLYAVRLRACAKGLSQKPLPPSATESLADARHSRSGGRGKAGMGVAANGNAPPTSVLPHKGGGYSDRLLAALLLSALWSAPILERTDLLEHVLPSLHHVLEPLAPLSTGQIMSADLSIFADVLEFSIGLPKLLTSSVMALTIFNSTLSIIGGGALVGLLLGLSTAYWRYQKRRRSLETSFPLELSRQGETPAQVRARERRQRQRQNSFEQSRRDFLKQAAKVGALGAAIGAMGGTATVWLLPERGDETQRDRLIGASRQLLRHLEHDGWLPVGGEWTTERRQTYLEAVRTFVKHPQLAPSTDRPSFLWIDPKDHSRIYFRTESIAVMSALDIEMALAHELLHQTPRHNQLGAADDRCFRATSGRSFYEAAARDAFKHGVGLRTTSEMEAWRLELRIAEHQAAGAGQDVEAYLTRRAQEATDSRVRLLHENLAIMHRKDPAVITPQIRTDLILGAHVVLSASLENGLRNLHAWEFENGLTTLGLRPWLISWIADPRYAELRPEDRTVSIRPPGIITAGILNFLNRRAQGVKIIEPKKPPEPGIDQGTPPVGSVLDDKIKMKWAENSWQYRLYTTIEEWLKTHGAPEVVKTLIFNLKRRADEAKMLHPDNLSLMPDTAGGSVSQQRSALAVVPDTSYGRILFEIITNRKGFLSLLQKRRNNISLTLGKTEQQIIDDLWNVCAWSVDAGVPTLEKIFWNDDLDPLVDAIIHKIAPYVETVEYFRKPALAKIAAMVHQSESLTEEAARTKVRNEFILPQINQMINDHSTAFLRGKDGTIDIGDLDPQKERPRLYKLIEESTDLLEKALMIPYMNPGALGVVRALNRLEAAIPKIRATHEMINQNVQPTQAYLVAQGGSTSDRNTNPAATGRSAGNPGRAIRWKQIPDAGEDFAQSIDPILREVLDKNRRRLIYGLTNQEAQALIDLAGSEQELKKLPEEYARALRSMKVSLHGTLTPRGKYALRFDQRKMQLLLTREDYAVQFVRFKTSDESDRRNIVLRVDAKPLKRGRNFLIQDLMDGLGASMDPPQNGEVVLIERIKQRIEEVVIEIRAEHDYPETYIEGPTAYIIFPEARVPSPKEDNHMVNLRYRWDWQSEAKHLLLPEKKDPNVEPAAFLRSIALDGIEQAIKVHELPLVAGSYFAQQVVNLLRRALNEVPGLQNMKFAAQKKELQKKRENLSGKSYIDLIFENLWEQLENHTFVDLDGLRKDRNTNPARMDGPHKSSKAEHAFSHEISEGSLRQGWRLASHWAAWGTLALLGMNIAFHYLTGEAILPWASTVAPLAALGVMADLIRTRTALKKQGQRTLDKHPDWPSPRPRKLFSFPVDAEDTDFVEHTNLHLRLHPSLAALLSPQTPWFTRFRTKLRLFRTGVPLHEGLHASGENEISTYGLGQIFPAAVGFFMGSYLFEQRFGHDVVLGLLGGVMAMWIGMILSSTIFVVLAYLRPIRWRPVAAVFLVLASIGLGGTEFLLDIAQRLRWRNTPTYSSQDPKSISTDALLISMSEEGDKIWVDEVSKQVRTLTLDDIRNAKLVGHPKVIAHGVTLNKLGNQPTGIGILWELELSSQRVLRLLTYYDDQLHPLGRMFLQTNEDERDPADPTKAREPSTIQFGKLASYDAFSTQELAVMEAIVNKYNSLISSLPANFQFADGRQAYQTLYPIISDPFSRDQARRLLNSLTQLTLMKTFLKKHPSPIPRNLVHVVPLRPAKSESGGHFDPELKSVFSSDVIIPLHTFNHEIAHYLFHMITSDPRYAKLYGKIRNHFGPTHTVHSSLKQSPQIASYYNSDGTFRDQYMALSEAFAQTVDCFLTFGSPDRSFPDYQPTLSDLYFLNKEVMIIPDFMLYSKFMWSWKTLREIHLHTPLTLENYYYPLIQERWERNKDEGQAILRHAYPKEEFLVLANFFKGTDRDFSRQILDYFMAETDRPQSADNPLTMPSYSYLRAYQLYKEMGHASSIQQSRDRLLASIQKASDKEILAWIYRELNSAHKLPSDISLLKDSVATSLPRDRMKRLTNLAWQEQKNSAEHEAEWHKIYRFFTEIQQVKRTERRPNQKPGRWTVPHSISVERGRPTVPSPSSLFPLSRSALRSFAFVGFLLGGIALTAMGGGSPDLLAADGGAYVLASGYFFHPLTLGMDLVVGLVLWAKKKGWMGSLRSSPPRSYLTLRAV